MRFPRLPLIALAVLLALSASAAPAGDPVMTVSEVRARLEAARAAGRKLEGYGKSVFSGTAIERFDVEIIDILPNFLPQQDLFLFRGRHPALDKGGIIAGMSGSPVYLEDRVIGAVAYGWTFSREPIGGITPIEAMRAELARPRERATGARPRPPSPPGSSAIQRVRTPLLAAGLTPRALALLEADLAPWGFVPLQGGGGGADDRGAELLPGSAVGVQLLSGDFDITAVGTLTYRDGDRILAFGHPFFNAGEIAMPVTTAVVHIVLPSMAMPFKLASPGREAGVLVQDRTACVAGVLGKAPSPIPLEVALRSRKTPASKTFRFGVLRHELLTPMLVRAAVFGAVDAWEPGMELNTLTAATTVRLKGVGDVTVRDTFANEGHTFNIGILRPFAILFDNPYREPEVESVRIDLELLHEERVAFIKQVWLEEDEVEAGSRARVNVRLRVRKGEETLRTLEIPVPAGLRGREIAVRVAGGAAVDPQFPPPTNLAELAEALRAPYPSTALVAVAALPTGDLRYRGHVLDRIPNSILGPLVPGVEDPALLTPTQRHVVAATDWVLMGEGEVTIRVR